MKFSAETYKVACRVLTLLLFCVAWEYFDLYRQITRAAFISYQAARLRESIQYAKLDIGPGKAPEEAVHQRDSVLRDLDWYVGYCDSRINSFSTAAVRGLVLT